ncbi:hypothetical protein PQ465_14910 [Sphingobacterium oryzagri]|uniref:Uncharacterized protein n=1 Tax=Sphingobacterium oryzagri TaxID=3025669 RepID=A0ABY7WGT1_9SPHI|nr:hypothetical protein [Sphingobacterium sp. KACC 22765]WDF67588.1 hypothetical protein PQ465_14910 [Sphingobacterium sp. KACC 22765]
MELIKRLDSYNLHYGFLENSKDFDFKIHPERIIIRNDALRTNDRQLYATYVKKKFPKQAAAALASYDSTAARLLKLTRTEAAELFKTHGVNILRSDISTEEQDAIFKAMVIPDDELPTKPENTKEKLIHNCVRPEVVLGRPYIWIDASGLPE